MTEASKPPAAPSVNGADVGEAGAMHCTARHVDDFLSEDFSGLVHDKGVHEIKSDLSGSFDPFSGFAKACLAIFFAAAGVETAILVAANAELVSSSDFDDARYPARRPSKQGLLGYFADAALALVSRARCPQRSGPREQQSVALSNRSVDHSSDLGNGRRKVNVGGVSGTELTVLVPAPHVCHPVTTDGNIVASD